jgi:hypothetical protein
MNKTENLSPHEVEVLREVLQNVGKDPEPME